MKDLKDLSTDNKLVVKNMATFSYAAADLSILKPRYTYFIQHAGTHYYKVGSTKDLASRKRHLQCGNPIEHNYFALLNWDAERELHQTLKPFHYRGEWFELDKARLLFVINQVIHTYIEKHHKDYIRPAWYVSLPMLDVLDSRCYHVLNGESYTRLADKVVKASDLKQIFKWKDQLYV